MPSATTHTVEPLDGGDLVAIANCIAIDADAFPYPSAPFGLRDRAARAWVARDGGTGRVIGFIAGRVRGGDLHVDGIAVHAGARRRGVGRALVRAAAEGARREGLVTVSLHVSVANREAHELYLGEGFTSRRRIRGFYAPGAFEEHARDAWEMVRIVG
jgi:ribosomal protein S18 acetylase RimI-like enzyme